MPPGHSGGEKHFSADCGEGNIGFSTPFGAIPSMIKTIGIGQWLLYIIFFVIEIFTEMLEGRKL